MTTPRRHGPLHLRPQIPCRFAGSLGPDGNVFAIIGKVQRTLREAGQPDLASAFVEQAFQSRSYDEVLQLCLEYVEIQ